MTELWSTFTGLSCAWDLSFWHIVVEIDGMNVLRIVQRLSQSHGDPGLAVHIYELYKREWTVSFQHISHLGNTVADHLANMANMDNLEFSVYMVPLMELEFEQNVDD
ncbi:hypothetical protein V6N13_132975 [Hibiscus sabdariffa]